MQGLRNTIETRKKTHVPPYHEKNTGLPKIQQFHNSSKRFRLDLPIRPEKKQFFIGSSIWTRFSSSRWGVVLKQWG